MAAPWEEFGGTATVEDGPWNEFGSHPADEFASTESRPLSEHTTESFPELKQLGKNVAFAVSPAASAALSEYQTPVADTAEAKLSRLTQIPGQIVEDVMTPANLIPAMSNEAVAKTAPFVDPSGIFNIAQQVGAGKYATDTAGALQHLTAGLVNFFTTPAGIATIGIGAAPKGIQTASKYAFATQGGKALPDSLQRLSEAKTFREMLDALGEVGMNTGMFGAAGHAAFGRPVGAPRPAGLPQQTIDRAITENQLQALAPEPSVAAREVQPMPSDVMDGLHLTREVRVKELQKATTAEERAKAQAEIDDIDNQLLEADRNEVAASRERVASRGQSRPPESAPVPPDTTTGVPPAEGGTSGLFAQARKEAGVEPPPVPAELIVKVEETNPTLESIASSEEGTYWYQGVGKDGKSSWVTSNPEKARQYSERHGGDGVINVFTPEQVGETAFADREGNLISPQEYARTQSKDTTIQTLGRENQSLPKPKYTFSSKPKTKSPAEMTPAEHAQYVIERDKINPDDVVGIEPHGIPRLKSGSSTSLGLSGPRTTIQNAFEEGKPVNATLFEETNKASDHPLKMPEGYVREGDLLVKKGEAIPSKDQQRVDAHTRVDEIKKRIESSTKDTILADTFETTAKNAIDKAIEKGTPINWQKIEQWGTSAGMKEVSKTESLDAGSEAGAPRKEAVAPVAAVENAEPISAMNAAMDKALSPRDAQIVRDAQEMSMEEVGKKHGISKARVSQIVQESLPKIRKEMEKAGITREDVAFDTERQAALPSHLRTSSDVADILAGAAEEAGAPMRRLETREGGAFGFGGGGKPKVRPVGSTPRGDTNFIHVAPAIERLGKGLMTEGAADVIGKTKNKIGQALAKAMRRHVDLDQELIGQMQSIVDRKTAGMSAKHVKTAIEELEPYLRAKENGRPLPKISPNAIRILEAWQDIAEQTGILSEAHGVKVFDPTTGSYRDMRRIGRDYVPRVLRPEVQKALSDPNSNPKLFNDLSNDLAASRGITPEEAGNLLRKQAGRFSSTDFMGNIELARGEKLPESFYDYNLGNIMSRYVPAYAERMAQIIAYGQRLGPREAPVRQNLWDVAMGETQDARTQEYLRAAEDQATNTRARNGFTRAAMSAQTAASGLLLSSPITVSRNLLSGVSATAELLGARRAAENLAKSSKGDARALGVIRTDMADFLHAEQLGDSRLENAIRGTAKGLLKISGYDASEQFVRSHAAATASSFIRQGVEEINKNPASSKAKEALALMKRMDVDAEKIVAEGGDWKTGPETRTFIRTIIKDSQGGYRFDQVPLWANSPAGRFFYQFGRYGTQRARNIYKNMIQPALGETVEWNGKTMERHDFAPLAKAIIASAVLGETFAGLSQGLFGRDRRDASLNEIQQAWSEDEKSALRIGGERLINDMIMSGTAGIFGQPVDWIKAAKDQSRFKNPAEPPSGAHVRMLANLAGDLADQGTLTRRDVLDALGGGLPGVKQAYDTARNVLGEPLYEAENDVRTLRNAGLRWAQSRKLDVPKKTGSMDIRKSPNAPIYEPIQEALLVGDASRAKYLADKFIKAQKNPDDARRNLRLSVKAKQPFRIGPFTNPDLKNDFMKWAQRTLPKADVDQVRRVQSRYERAAQKAGLWSTVVE